jgi:hypothetical protein
LWPSLPACLPACLPSTRLLAFQKAAEAKKFAASLGSDNVKNDIIANELMLG